MFGPNKVLNTTVYNSSSHRSMNFKELYKRVTDVLKMKWNVLNEFEVIFIPGSGTVGIEAVISSISAPIDYPSNRGRFADKWSSMIDLYKGSKDIRLSPLRLEVHFETSLSTLNKLENISIVDGISSFPYYDIPRGTDVFVTCSNKQMGSLVGLAIIFIRKSVLELLMPPSVSYLNLYNYVERAQDRQTPTTFPEFQLNQLLKTLETFDIGRHREEIDLISNMILNKIPCEFIVGDVGSSPCISIKKSFFKKEISDILYSNEYTSTCQIFTYSHPHLDYVRFLKSI